MDGLFDKTIIWVLERALRSCLTDLKLHTLYDIYLYTSIHVSDIYVYYTFYYTYILYTRYTSIHAYIHVYIQCISII